MHYGPPTGPETSPLFYQPPWQGESAPQAPMSPLARWGLALGGLLLGTVLVLVAVGQFLGGRAQTTRGPRVVKAAELRHIDEYGPVEDPWVAYTAAKTFDPGIRIYRTRKRNSLVKYVVLQVEDRWLLACVPPDFVGSRVEGRLTVWDGPRFNEVMQRVHAASPARIGRQNRAKGGPAFNKKHSGTASSCERGQG